MKQIQSIQRKIQNANVKSLKIAKQIQREEILLSQTAQPFKRIIRKYEELMDSALASKQKRVDSLREKLSETEEELSILRREASQENWKNVVPTDSEKFVKFLEESKRARKLFQQTSFDSLKPIKVRKCKHANVVVVGAREEYGEKRFYLAVRSPGKKVVGHLTVRIPRHAGDRTSIENYSVKGRKTKLFVLESSLWGSEENSPVTRWLHAIQVANY